MNKLDEDLNEIIKKGELGRLSLQTTVNIGLQLVMSFLRIDENKYRYADLKLCMILGLFTEI